MGMKVNSRANLGGNLICPDAKKPAHSDFVCFETEAVCRSVEQVRTQALCVLGCSAGCIGGIAQQAWRPPLDTPPTLIICYTASRIWPRCLQSAYQISQLDTRGMTGEQEFVNGDRQTLQALGALRKLARLLPSRQGCFALRKTPSVLILSYAPLNYHHDPCPTFRFSSLSTSSGVFVRSCNAWIPPGRSSSSFNRA